MFFKNEVRETEPSCAEANEYLAEDAVMCMQLYTKPVKGWLVQYIPNAIAKTDVPDNMVYLMKQRRRWYNGAIFGRARIIANFFNMISCRRNQHPVYQQLGQVIFMTFFVMQYTLS
jgi:chitin synthase